MTEEQEIPLGSQPGGGYCVSSRSVLIVEDFEPFRRFICSTLRNRTELQVICEASDGLEAVKKAEELQPDLILLDIGLPTLDGIEAACRISRRVPGAKVLFVSMSNDTDVVTLALSNGAKGYVRKENAQTDLLPAIEAVLRGDRFVSKGFHTEESPQAKPRYVASWV
jgi:DNA-binding NarL/FixJ family response regulator